MIDETEKGLQQIMNALDKPLMNMELKQIYRKQIMYHKMKTKINEDNAEISEDNTKISEDNAKIR